VCLCFIVVEQIRTMKANYKIEAGDVSVIRPLIYVREHQVCVMLIKCLFTFVYFVNNRFFHMYV